MPCLRLVALIVFAGLLFTTSAEAKKRHHTYRSASIGGSGCVQNNDGKTICGMSQTGPLTTSPMGRRHIAPSRGYDMAEMVVQTTRRGGRSDVRFIPNPPGTWRVYVSCAHRLAAYWNLGPGLDAVSTWPRRFAQVSGPAIGIAVVRPGHIMGIIGGGPGAWRVADFNSGYHLNREYTVASFGNVTFVDPRSRKTAGL